MASFLRQIVASPRVKHQETNLDLCYATDNIIVTSGPSDSYPKVAYRNPLKSLVAFLNDKHKDKWYIWEFRAEGTGYPDLEVYNRINHYPWPDHHPPPFALIPLIMGSMRNWLKADGEKDRVAVIHCKAGKGRSGTVTCSYLISEEGWTPEDAMKRFTERRIRPGFGAGISIPSQKRTIRYVDRWTKHGKKYVERAAEVVEVHIWGLRDGVRVAVEGFIDEGKVIKKLHTFTNAERQIITGKIKDTSFSDVALELLGRKKDRQATPPTESSDSSVVEDKAYEEETGADVIYKPETPIHVPSSDICLDFERRARTKLGGFSMVTAIAHVWFNIFFEGRGPEQDGHADESGIFELEWEALDGLKGSSRKGTKAFDKMAVVWQASCDEKLGDGVEIREPEMHEEVKQTQPADWRQSVDKSDDYQSKLGFRSAARDEEEPPISQQEKDEPLSHTITRTEATKPQESLDRSDPTNGRPTSND